MSKVMLYAGRVLMIAGVIAGVISALVIGANATAGCPVNVNNHAHMLVNGQLLSYPGVQLLCRNGTVWVETRNYDTDR